MAKVGISKKYCRNAQSPNYGARTLQTVDDRRICICDSKNPNVTQSRT